MIDNLKIKTSGIAILSKKQAKHFALLILADIKVYINKHKTEYKQWLIKPKEGNTLDTRKP